MKSMKTKKIIGTLKDQVITLETLKRPHLAKLEVQEFLEFCFNLSEERS